MSRVVLLIPLMSSFFPATPSSVRLKHHPKLDSIKNHVNMYEALTTTSPQ